MSRFDKLWEERYALAKEFYVEYGHLAIPAKYKVGEVNLGSWVCTQRDFHKKGLLLEKRKDALDSIGMIWENKSNASQSSFPEQAIFYYLKKAFKDAINRDISFGFELDIYIPSLKLAVEYDGYRFHSKRENKDYEKNAKCQDQQITLLRIRECGLSNIDGSINFIRENGKDASLEEAIRFIFNFIANIYSPKLKNSNINLAKDSKEITAQLNESSLNTRWMNNYSLAKKYFKENGDLLIPRDYNISKVKLGNWISNQRTQYRRGTLPQERIDLLNKIGMVWEVTNFEEQWNEQYALAEKYFKENGDLLISRDYNISGAKLGEWIKRQRRLYKEGVLSQERIDLLNKIGMVWKVINFEEQWINNYILAKKYFEENGNLLIPAKYDIDGIRLGLWISRQRKQYKEETLSQEKINLLNEIGMVWKTRQSSKTK